MEHLSLEVAAIIGAMTWTLVSFLRHMRAKDYASAMTLATVVAGGIGFAFLVQAADMALQGAKPALVVIVGYGAVSVIRIPWEFKKAFDQTDSAKEPALFVNASPPTA